MDGIFRIWGCMIDEPDFFSLWATLDVHASLPKHLPLATCFRATNDMWPSAEGEPTRHGKEDEFVTVFSDGSVHLTTVSVSHASRRVEASADKLVEHRATTADRQHVSRSRRES